MMAGCVVGLDDVWQASGMAHSVEHYGQISMVAELVASGDWEPMLVPPLPRLPRNASHSTTRAVAAMARIVRHAAARRDRAHDHARGARRGSQPAHGEHAHATHAAHHEPATGRALASSEQERRPGSTGADTVAASNGEGDHVPPPFGNDVTRHDVFPENVKQAAVLKVRSRFAQPNEMRADALRVTLVERGGKDVASLWLELPAPPTPLPTASPTWWAPSGTPMVPSAVPPGTRSASSGTAAAAPVEPSAPRADGSGD